MMKPRLEKVVVNMGVGEGAEKLQKAEGVMEQLTGQKPVRTYARTSVRDWNVRKASPIGCKVTLRGQKAQEFLKRALWVRNGRVAEWCFDAQGNVSFGIGDHTDFEGQRYDPEVGVFGMDITIVLERPGVRIKNRRIQTSRVPKRHRVGRDEAKGFLSEHYSVEVVE